MFGAALLSPEEYNLIESFLNRRADLAFDVRYRVADDILFRLTPKLTLPTDNRISPEKVLEALAQERRTISRYS